MNYIFISPEFPENYYKFVIRLKEDGVNVLGIGDTPYDNLRQELKDNLTEYYYVHNLGNYDEMLRAVAFFTFKYGKIDWLESNNEYWLEQDARLRTDFNITTGLKSEEMGPIKRKSMMKACYEKAGVKCARWHLVDDIDGCRNFIKEVSYPVVVKPDNGVGANNTYRLSNEADLRDFFLSKKKKDVLYIMEEYIDGTIQTFDGVADSECEPIYYASYSETDSMMDVVNENKDTWYYVKKEIQPELIKAGKATLKAFNCHNRYFHLEFFIANSPKEGRWKKGEVLALEVNMRPAGGFTPDMEDYSAGVDLYKIYADMVAYDTRGPLAEPKRQYCVYAANREEYAYLHSREDILKKYGSVMKMEGIIPKVLQGDMGAQYYMACFDKWKDVLDFVKYVLERKGGKIEVHL